jgi:hypothetical protein
VWEIRKVVKPVTLQRARQESRDRISSADTQKARGG